MPGSAVRARHCKADLQSNAARFSSHGILYKLWGRLFSLRTRFPASPAGRKAGLRPRLAAPQQMQNDSIGKNERHWIYNRRQVTNLPYKNRAILRVYLAAPQ